MWCLALTFGPSYEPTGRRLRLQRMRRGPEAIVSSKCHFHRSREGAYHRFAPGRSNGIIQAMVAGVIVLRPSAAGQQGGTAEGQFYWPWVLVPKPTVSETCMVNRDAACAAVQAFIHSIRAQYATRAIARDTPASALGATATRPCPALHVIAASQLGPFVGQRRVYAGQHNP